MAAQRWRERLIRRWDHRQADRPDARLPFRLVIGFVISMATVAVLLGVILPAVGWTWTLVLVVAYGINPTFLPGLPKPYSGGGRGGR